ncbi:MAG: hypothetical protein LUE17_11010 [Planctomycetaceae bacterium]|nr:hypothetical protein [Planctomycetaceae bacterium]
MKILCLGDSLTFGTGVTRSNAWTTLVHKQTGYEVVNRGVPGDTTGGMLPVPSTRSSATARTRWW